MWFLSNQISVFKQHIDNYYTGENQSRSRWLIAVGLSLVLYYVVCIIDIALFDPVLDNIFMWIRSSLVLVNGIAFIKCRDVYWDIKPAFVDMDVDHGYIFEPVLKTDHKNNPNNAADATATAIATSGANGDTSADANTVSPENIDAQHRDAFASIDIIVTQWTERPDKPFLKESITIMQVAEQMELNTRLLSNYINNVKGRNFNAWINFLKVEETKRALLADRTRPLSEIAYEMGFTDSAALSKIFKSVEGIPPSVYRQTH